MPRVTQKQIYLFLKIVLALSSIAFFISVWNNSGLESNIIKQSKELILAHPLVCSLIPALMLINWYIESIKFRLLIASHVDLGKFQAFAAVLAGTTVSNFTPARTGDFIGRVALLPAIRPIRVVLATITANMSQLLMTYLMGLIFGLIFLLTSSRWGLLQGHWWRLILFLVLLSLAVLAVRWILKQHSRFEKKLPAILNKAIRIVRNYPRAVLQKVLRLALLRYLTFSLQFYLLLQLVSSFGLNLYDFIKVPLAYLMQSLFPVPAVADLGVRVYVTELLYSPALQTEQIVFAVTALWFINLIVPSIIGALSLLYSLFAKS